MSYNTRVGERLRTIRRRHGLSLQDVQERSAGEFKAAVLGAYERGERSLSVQRLHRLAVFYGMPEAGLLPREERPETGSPVNEVLIDLTRIDRLDDATGDVIERYLASIRRERKDFTGDVLTVRAEDLRVLSRLAGDDEALAQRLDEIRFSGDGGR